MLVAQTVLQGPESSHISHGDIFVKVNNDQITQFVRLDSILDNNVNKEVSITD